MKKTVITLLIFICFYSSAQEKLIGTVKKTAFEKDSYKEWFLPNYKNYQVHKSLIRKVKKDLKQHQIKVFLGTWCGDSKREVPAFFKILDQVSFPESQLQIICLDNIESAYKKSPNGEEVGLNIHRVPTFVFYKDGEEVNRIVETPITSLERDISKIVTKEKYNANYQVVSILEEQLKTKTITQMKTMEKQFLFLTTEYSKGSKELNTYGYVKLSSNELDKAIYILELNNKAYPLNKNTFDSLGKGYFKAKRFEDAKKCFYKILELDPKNKSAKEMLSKINCNKE